MSPSLAKSQLGSELFAARAELQVTKLVAQQVEEVILPLVHDHVVRSIAHVTEHSGTIFKEVKSLLKHFDTRICKLEPRPQPQSNVDACIASGIALTPPSAADEAPCDDEMPTARSHAKDERDASVVFAPPAAATCGADACNAHKARRKSTCTMSQFLEMSKNAKERIPHVRQLAQSALCLRDATTVELVHLIHCRRHEWGKCRNLGPYTLQQAACLHIASDNNYNEMKETRKIELEEAAKREDELMLFVPNQSHSHTVCSAHSVFSSGSKDSQLELN